MSSAICSLAASFRARRAATCSRLAIALFALCSSAPEARAASIAATPATSTLTVGGTFAVAVDLALAPGEDASILEAFFAVSGPATLSFDAVGFGATWSSSFGFVSPAGDQVGFSLLSSQNRSDHGAIGVLHLTPSAAGLVELRLASVVLQRDLSSSPFFEDIPVANGSGSVLASFLVVPEPGTALFVGLGLLALSRQSRRRTGN